MARVQTQQSFAQTLYILLFAYLHLKRYGVITHLFSRQIQIKQTLLIRKKYYGYQFLLKDPDWRLKNPNEMMKDIPIYEDQLYKNDNLLHQFNNLNLQDLEDILGQLWKQQKQYQLQRRF
ncbi:unnamed protein product [Paramecium sonneborni]|uniref:Uncharacterized protein n=1 Tax=Paramecium sonneborni TaxID=65129 RepID=A0A8S1LNE3_9CILI|nr:unnamed protein product [Paramecium sonneborni]